MNDSYYYKCSSDSHSNKNDSYFYNCSTGPVIVREGGNEDWVKIR